MMASDDNRPTLNFFRATPHGMLAQPPLASSLQSFETCLFLLGLDRYPSAVVSCATAWESALKAKLAIGPEERGVTLEKMLTDIRSRSEPLRMYDEEKLDAFRRKRNQLVHFGFSPKDDQECATLLLETGLPFLSLCYRVLFDFYLDWQEVRPGTTEFTNLTPEEMAKAGLLSEVAEQLRFVREISYLAKRHGKFDPTHCFSAFRQFIRLGLKESANTESELDIIKHADTHGLKFELEQKAKKDLEKLLEPSWVFNCPICYGFDSVVAELDETRLHDHQIVTDRCACVQCGFVVGKGTPYISQILLTEQIANNRAEILKGFGLGQGE
jgi:hypothetical protein